MSFTDRRTDGRTDKVNPVYPPPTSLGGGITKKIRINLLSDGNLPLVDTFPSQMAINVESISLRHHAINTIPK